MANVTINALPPANSIDAVQDLLPIYQNSSVSTLSINRNTYLGLGSAPVGLTDSQSLTNKTLTSPTISSPALSGTLSGTYTLGGTPTFPSSVVTLAGSQVLTNKTLTSPTINSPTITNASISADTLTGYTVSNTGTVYGISVSTGTIGSAALAANSVTNSQIASGALYTSKVYNPYKFSYYRNGGFTAGSPSLITFDTLVFDTSSNYSVSTGKFTAPVSGFYQFNAAVGLSLADTSLIYTSLYKNGSLNVVGTNFFTGGGPGTNSATVSALIQLAQNDFVQVNCYGAGATGVTGSTITWFNGFLVSAT